MKVKDLYSFLVKSYGPDLEKCEHEIVVWDCEKGGIISSVGFDLLEEWQVEEEKERTGEVYEEGDLCVKM